MKKISIMLFSLLFADMCYADCSTKNTIATFNVLPLSVNSLTYSYTLPYSIGQQIMSGCNSPTNIFLNSYFTSDQYSTSASSPFAPSMSSSDMQILTPGTTSAASIEKAKIFLTQNFRFTYNLKDNSSGGTAVNILAANTQYNIVPHTTSDPSNTILNNGTLYSTGNQNGYGIASAGVQIKDATFSFLNLISPSSEVLKTLNGATLKIKLGVLHSSYYYMYLPNTIYTLDTDIYIQIPFKITMPTCTVDVPDTLDLGTTTRMLLNQNSQNNHSFDVNIKCPISMVNNNFKLTILDANDISNQNNNGILTNSSTSDLKSNAVIQLINNMTSAPFQIGTQVDYFSSTSGSSFINKSSAQLLKTTTNTTSGNVEGRATFLIDYE